MISAGNTDSNKLNDIEVSINLLRKIFTCKIWHEFWENIFSSWINRNRQTQRFFGSKWSGKTSSFPIWIVYLLFRVQMHRISSWIVWFSFTVVIRWVFMVLLHIEDVLLFYFYIFFSTRFQSVRKERSSELSLFVITLLAMTLPKMSYLLWKFWWIFHTKLAVNSNTTESIAHVPQICWSTSHMAEPFEFAIQFSPPFIHLFFKSSNSFIFLTYSRHWQ